MIVCVANIGSTSLKSSLIEIDDRFRQTALASADLERVTEPQESRFTATIGGVRQEQELISVEGYEQGLRYILSWYTGRNIIQSLASIDCVGFKCVLGERNGANHLTPGILAEMERFLFVAPVHNGPYLRGIEEFRRVLDVPLIGVFEPSFHYSVPEYRRFLGLPYQWHEFGIRTYGFHGASHRYLGACACSLLGINQARVISIHLGGSSSICAQKGGLSIDINQDFSPNSGLLQGTRVGHLDGTALLYAMQQLNLSIEEAQRAISYDAGLKSMAGLGTADMKTICTAAAAGDKRATMTRKLYVDGVRKCIGGYAAVLSGVDALIFGGGVGEGSPEIRQECLEGLEFMGIELDSSRNSRPLEGRSIISQESSPVTVAVARTDEAAVIAYFSAKAVQAGRDLRPEEMVFRLQEDDAGNKMSGR
jgi:acetate kinase